VATGIDPMMLATMGLLSSPIGPTWKSRHVRFCTAIRGIAGVKWRPPIYE